MFVAGLILLILGVVLGVHLLVVLGIVGIAVGLILLALAETGHPVGGRRWY